MKEFSAELPAILKLPGLLTGNFGGVCFQYTSYKWYIGQLESIKKSSNKDVQKQPSRGVLKKRCSENMQQIYWRTPMPKCNFNKVGLQLYRNHTSARVFSCKFAAYFQNTSSWEHTRRLLLDVFSGNFAKFSHSSYANIPRKFYEIIFQKNVDFRKQFCYFNIITSP